MVRYEMEDENCMLCETPLTRDEKEIGICTVCEDNVWE